MPGRNWSPCSPGIRTSGSRPRCRRRPTRPRGRCPGSRGSGTARSSRSNTDAARQRDGPGVSWRCPRSAAAELAPPLVDAGVRVIDLSGAFRIRDAAARARWYPATKTLPAGVGYGLTEHYRDDVRARAARRQSRAATRRPRCWRCCRSRKAGLLDAAGGRRSSTRSPASPARAARRATARTSPRTTDRSSPTACSAIVTSRRWNRSWARR